MVDVIITYETLFDLLRKEKAREELQHLPSDFYGQVVAYLRQKRADVDAAGGFTSPTAQKALVQFRNVQRILRELYERRERKALEMALSRARSQANLIDTSAPLAQERRLFEDAAALLRGQKAFLLEPALEGVAPHGVTVPELPITETAGSEAEQSPKPSLLSSDDVAAQESCAVRFVADVPRFLGLHGEILGPFATGQSASFPGKIAAVLIKKKRAELV